MVDARHPRSGGLRIESCELGARLDLDVVRELVIDRPIDVQRGA